MKGKEIADMLEDFINDPSVKLIEITAWESRDNFSGDIDSTSVSHLPIIRIEKFDEKR